MNPYVFLFGGGGGLGEGDRISEGTRVSDFFFTMNPNLKFFFEGGGGRVWGGR